jgi:hypothetical protein
VGVRVAVLVACLAASAGAEEKDPEVRARVLYQHGKEAFDHGRFVEAHEAFRKAYLISQRAELLFDMAAALQGADRPHDAAEDLRAYLRVRPGDADRERIEEHVRALEEKQRLIDAARPHPTSAPVVVAQPARPEAALPRRPLYRRWWLWTVAAAVVVAGAAVGLGFGLASTSATTYPSVPTTEGTFRF